VSQSLNNQGRERLVAVGHYLTAFVLSTKAVSYMQHAPPDWSMATLCLAAALLAAAATVFHHRIETRLPSAQGLIHLVEATVCAVLAWHTHAEGKSGLPFAWTLAAVIFLARGIWELRRPASGRRAAAP
jgi:ABC-type branched-subunit amino acid transport system permease subunit